MRWLENKCLNVALVIFLCLWGVPSAGASTWQWSGTGVSGSVEVKEFHSLRMAAADQIAAGLGYQTRREKEELVVQAPVGLRFVRGAAVVWIGYSVVALPARARMEDGHWWVDTDTVLSVFSRFLKRNGRNVVLQWSGTGKRQTPSAERGSGDRKKTPANDAPQQGALRQEQQKAQDLPRLKALRWGGDHADVRAVIDLEGSAEPSYTVRDETLTVVLAPMKASQRHGLKSARSDIALSVKNDSTARLDFSFPGRTVKVFTLSDPYRLVMDFKLDDTTSRRNESGEFSARDGSQKDEKKLGAKGGEDKSREKKPPSPAPRSRKGKKLVVIDAGHGGKDPGAMAHGYREKDLALQIAKRVAKELRSRAVTVRMTREGDTYPTLRERTQMANDWKADVFISIHLNALPKGRHSKGVEIYIMALPTDKDAMTLARIENAEIAEDSSGKKGSSDKRTEMLLSILGNMQQNAKIDESTDLAEELFKAGQESRLDMKRVAQAPFWVLRGAVMPSVLIETGFITELSEAKRLAQPAYQQRMAESIASGIINFINR